MLSFLKTRDILAIPPLSRVLTRPGLLFGATIVFSAVGLTCLYHAFSRWSRPSTPAFLEVVLPSGPSATVPAGHRGEVSVELRNVWDCTITVYGVTTHCGCFHAVKLPLAIPPRQSRSLDFSIETTADQAGSRVSQSATFYTDAPVPTYEITVEIEVASLTASSST